MTGRWMGQCRAWSRQEPLLAIGLLCALAALALLLSRLLPGLVALATLALTVIILSAICMLCLLFDRVASGGRAESDCDCDAATTEALDALARRIALAEAGGDAESQITRRLRELARRVVKRVQANQGLPPSFLSDTGPGKPDATRD